MNPFYLEMMAKERQKRIQDKFKRVQLVQRANSHKTRWLTKTISGLISSVSMLWDSGGKR
jgi:hypothetical protein